MRDGRGFIEALDLSGGSSAKTLKNYGIDESEYSSEEEMFNLIHEMRKRVMTSKVFTNEHILGTILFEKTMMSEVNGKFTADYLWDEKGIVSFLKVDKGLAEEKNGVKLMIEIPNLKEEIEEANKKHVFGTKMRSVIYEANEEGIRDIVNQQFEFAKTICDGGLVPIIEPEVDIHSEQKELCEKILKDGSFAATGFILSGLATSPDGVDFRKDSGNFTSYDKKKAQESLDEGLKELGKSEITLRVTYGTDESPMDVFATYLQNALSKLDGIKVEMVATTKQDRIYNKQKNGDFDLATTRWGPDYGDPTTYLTMGISTNGNNYGKYTNSELDALMDKVANESDANTRWQKMKDAEKILLADYAYIPVFEKRAATLQNPKVKNLVIKPCRTISFEYVEKTE